MLRAVPQHGQAVTPAAMQIARDIISNRVTTIGVASPRVTIRGSDEIVIDYAGTHAPKNLAGVVSVRGELQFFDFEKDLASPTITNGIPTPYPTLYSLLAALPTAVSKGAPEAYYLFDATAPHRVMQGPAGTLKELWAPYGGKTP